MILGLLLVDHVLPDCLVNLPQDDACSERAHWVQVTTDSAAVGRLFSLFTLAPKKKCNVSEIVSYNSQVTIDILLIPLVRNICLHHDLC